MSAFVVDERTHALEGKLKLHARCDGGFCDGQRTAWRVGKIMDRPAANLCKKCAEEWSKLWKEMCNG